MIRIDDLESADLSGMPTPRCATAGVFDGLHRAHRRLVARTVEHAGPQGTPLVFTFANHPLSTLAPPYAPKLLITPEAKARGFEDMGIGVLVMPRFDTQLAALAPLAFVRDILVERLKIDRLVVGFDFRFGAKGEGHTELLAELAPRFGFQLEVLAPVRAGEFIVSSTRVRELIEEGHMREVEELLERPYELAGRVARGHGRGAELGYPTANLRFDDAYARPPSGVYAVFVRCPSGLFAGMMNIGCNPTFDGAEYSPEVYLFDYDGPSLYDRRLSVLFVQRLREERRFPGAEALRARLAVDEKLARGVLGAHALSADIAHAS